MAEKEYLFISFNTVSRDLRNNFGIDGLFDFVFSGKDFLFKKKYLLEDYDSRAYQEIVGKEMCVSDFEKKMNGFFDKGDADGLVKFLKSINAYVRFQLKQNLFYGSQLIKEVTFRFFPDTIREGDFIMKIAKVKEKDLKVHLVHGTQGI